MKTMKCCPRCYAQLVVMKSSLGTYLVCPNYPNCDPPVDLRKPVSSVSEYAHAA